MAATQTVEYLHQRTRNPLRIIRALWRLVRDLGATREATILEDVFARSALLKKYARWDLVVAKVMPGELSEQELQQLPRLPRLDLDELMTSCQPGSVGYAVAAHMQHYGLNPNLFHPATVTNAEDYALIHLTETHDIWHVVSGFGNDEPGEIGVVAFCCAQTGASIFLLLLSIMMLNTALFSQHKIVERFDALCEGWQAGKRAKPLFGIDWAAQWHRPIEEMRRELNLPAQVEAGVGIFSRAA